MLPLASSWQGMVTALQRIAWTIDMLLQVPSKRPLMTYDR